MKKEKLLYELEYEVNELRKSKLNEIRGRDMTIKELLDLGFDNCFIMINDCWYDLGYKWEQTEYNSKKTIVGYECNDFGDLDEHQLNTKITYITNEISEGNYLQVSVSLVNKEDSKYFKECE